MSNTIDGSLITVQHALTACQILESHVAPLKHFVTLSNGGQMRTGKLEIPLNTAVSAAAADPVDFQTGDSTIARSEVTVVHLVKRAYSSRPEENVGHQLTNRINSLARVFALDLFNAATAQLTTAGVGPASVTVAESSVAIANVQTCIKASGSGHRCALVSNTTMQNIQASLTLGSDLTWRFPGIQAGVFEAAVTGDGYAYICTPEALVGIVGRPEIFSTIPPRDVKIIPLPLPSLGIEVYLSAWFDKASRSGWMAVECLCGFAPGIGGAVKWIKAS